MWWIASWAEDEQLQGKNNLLRRGALVLGELVCGGRWNGSDPRPDEIVPFLWWWLDLFIEALVLSPNIEQEGIQQQPNSKGDY